MEKLAVFVCMAEAVAVAKRLNDRRGDHVLKYAWAPNIIGIDGQNRIVLQKFCAGQFVSEKYYVRDGEE